MVRLFYVASQQHRAYALAAWCDLVEVDAAELISTQSSGFSEPVLILDQLGLSLLMPGYRDPYRLPQRQVQRRTSTNRMGAVARACGVPQSKPSVLDACAGFGTDGLTLAALGCVVTMVERHPIVWLLLRDLCESTERVVVEQDDCLRVMQSQRHWDVVYLDPMFAPRRKNALPNRGLQHLRQLTATTADQHQTGLVELIQHGQACALNKVVVKQRLKDPLVLQPTFQIKGKSVRFDVYLPT